MSTPSVALPYGSGFLGGLRGGATSIYMVVVVGSTSASAPSATISAFRSPGRC
jgi:hypothetical protein